MRLFHNSRRSEYRVPFGAVVAGTTVHLTLRVEDADARFLKGEVRTWVDDRGEELIPMTLGESNTLVATIDCSEPCILWYSFRVTCTDGSMLMVGARDGATGGESVTYTDRTDVPSFQITVYKHRKTRPAWYERGIVYQIFPDRYARDEHWLERAQAVVDKPRKGPGKHLVMDWDKPPVYERNEDKSIKSWDFYGGSLEGIRQDLPRLHAMGVTTIYLNPIFEAQSNHRYDTADYLTIDPMLGTEEDFRRLAQDADKLGISLILDGVFNHTGDDSIYFNRFGNYPGKGAWQGEDSPWHDAYCWNEDGTYSSWWGIENMPDLNEKSDRVRELLLGENGVVRTWLRAGARGWRLDVSPACTPWASRRSTSTPSSKRRVITATTRPITSRSTPCSEPRRTSVASPKTPMSWASRSSSTAYSTTRETTPSTSTALGTTLARAHGRARTLPGMTHIAGTKTGHTAPGGASRTCPTSTRSPIVCASCCSVKTAWSAPGCAPVHAAGVSTWPMSSRTSLSRTSKQRCSPWHDAYCWNEDGTYSSWWGIENMPDLNEKSDRVRKLLLGENGVVRTWLRAGARGWRLDVADELSDELIEDIKAAVLEERPDGLLLGEVLEDASNKLAYGKLRKYLLGDELDSAMNYPLRDAILGFLVYGENAYQCAERIETLRENYPPEALASTASCANTCWVTSSTRP